MKKATINTNLLFFISILVSILSLEKNIYDYYFIISFIGLLILIMFVLYNLKHNLALINSTHWIFIILFSLSYFFISAIHINIIGSARGLAIFLVFFICFQLRRHIDRFLLIFIMLTSICAIISLLINIEGGFLFWTFKFERNPSIFFDPNYAAAIFSTSAILSLIILDKFTYRWLLFTLFFIALLFTYSKSGILSLALGIICYFYCLYSIKSVLYVFLFSLLLFLLFFYFGFDTSLFRLEQGLNSRDAYLWGTLDYVFNQGNLWGGDEDVLANVIRGVGGYNSSTHSYYLDSLLSNGIIPFFFLIPLLIKVLFSGIYRRNKYLPIFVTLFAFSNSISISPGGIGILSLILSFSIILILNNQK